MRASLPTKRPAPLLPTLLLLATLLPACGARTTVEDAEERAVDTRFVEALLRREGLMDRRAGGQPERGALVIDARPASASDGPTLPGAVRRSIADFPLTRSRDPSLRARDLILVYGQNPGDFSAKGLVQRLVRLKYDGVRWYRDGIDAWLAAGLPTRPRYPAPDPGSNQDPGSEPDPEPAPDPGETDDADPEP